MSINDPAAFLEQLAAEVADLRDRVDAMGVASLEALLTPQSGTPRLGATSIPSAMSGTGDVAPAAVIASGAVVSDSIAAGAIDFAKFASGIVPPRVSATAPTLPSANFPVGSFYFNSTDKHLYKTTDGNTWGLAVDAGDIVTNSITAGQIAVGAIGADEIAAGAITATKLAVGSTRNLVANDSFEAFVGTVAVDIPDDVGIQAVLPGWTSVTHPTGSKITVETGGKSGTKWLLLKQDTVTTATVAAYSNWMSVEPGRKYGARAWVRGTSVNSASTKARTYIFWYDSAYAFLSSSLVGESTVGTSGTFVEQLASVAAPSTASYARFVPYNPSTNAVGEAVGFDLCEFYESGYNAAGSVVVDGTGIAVTDGKLSVQDASGNTVITGGVVRVSGIASSADRVNLLRNGSCEDFTGTAGSYVYPCPLTGWTATSSYVISCATTSSNAKSGSYIGALKIDTGGAAYSGVHQSVSVRPGKKYRLSGWLWKGVAGGTPAWIVAHTYDKAWGSVATNVITLGNTTSGTPTFYEDTYTIPAGVAYLNVRVTFGTPAPANTEAVGFEDVFLEEVPTDVTNSDGNVLIDSTGITISNGKLTFKDNYGQTALTGSGFGQAWDDFIANGIYNSMFQLGTAGTLSDGATAALPYWVVSRSGTPVLTLTADTGMPGGKSIRFKPSATGQYGYLLSDLVPVQGGFQYSTSFLAAKVSLGAGFYLNPYITIYWYKADGVTAASTASSPGVSRVFTSADAATAMRVSTRVPAEAPPDARYAKVRLVFYAYGTFTGTPEIAVGAVRIENAPAQVQTDTLPSVNLVPLIFQRADVPASTTANMQVAGATGGGSIAMPQDGWIVGMTVRMSAARTAGDVTFDAVVSGSVSSLISCVINSLDTTQAMVTSGSDFVTNGEPFTTGDYLYVRFVSSSTWAPTTSDATVVLWVAMQGWA